MTAAPAGQPPGARPGRVAGILLAAGSSRRMGTDKLWAPLAGRPLIAWPILAFASCDSVDELVVVTAAASIDRTEKLLEELEVQARVVEGGQRRRDSVFAGLRSASDADTVVVHDAARPLVTSELIASAIVASCPTGAAIVAIPAVDTIKVVEEGLVVDTLRRDLLWSAQTPQAFRRSLLLDAHQAITDNATDDAALVESLGVPVRVCVGSRANIKVTTQTDLELAAALLAARRKAAKAESRAAGHERLAVQGLSG